MQADEPFGPHDQVSLAAAKEDIILDESDFHIDLGRCGTGSRMIDDVTAGYGRKNFDMLFAMRTGPDTHDAVQATARTTPTTRRYATYGNAPARDPTMQSYMFSSSGSAKNVPVHPCWLPFLNAVNDGRGVPGRPLYNQVTVNWYRDGGEHTPFHVDCTVTMPDGADIAVLSLCEEGMAARPFVIKPNGFHRNRVIIPTRHGQVITMTGDHKACRHGVPRAAGNVGRRISMSFRTYRGAPPGRADSGGRPSPGSSGSSGSSGSAGSGRSDGPPYPNDHSNSCTVM